MYSGTAHSRNCMNVKLPLKRREAIVAVLIMLCWDFNFAFHYSNGQPAKCCDGTHTSGSLSGLV